MEICVRLDDDDSQNGDNIYFLSGLESEHGSLIISSIEYEFFSFLVTITYILSTEIFFRFSE